MLLLKYSSPTGKERHYDAFLAGLLGGYTVFGRTIGNSVSQQIVIYVFARVVLALAKLAVQPRSAGEGGGMGMLEERSTLRRALVKNGWVGFASLSWAMVMYVWRWHPEAVQPSLRSSMNYMWVFPTVIGEGRFANEGIDMRRVMIGTRCGILFGTISEEGESEEWEKCKRKETLLRVHDWKYQEILCESRSRYRRVIESITALELNTSRNRNAYFMLAHLVVTCD